MLYNRADTLLLAEGMSAFRHEVYEHFGLDGTILCYQSFLTIDPTSHTILVMHYISIPQIAWDAFLYKTRAGIDLISESRMIDEIESSIRGGNSFTRERYAESSENEQIIYIDAYVIILHFILLGLK